MAITVSNVRQSHLGGGEVMVYGNFTFDNLYATGGETMDLSSYILTGDTPHIVLTGDDGWVCQGDRGTAAANKVLVYGAADTNASTAMTQCAANVHLSAVIGTFIAIGRVT